MQKNAFKAGQIKYFEDAWEKLTSDSWILEAIQGVTIEFTELPYQHHTPREPVLGYTEAKAVDNEIKKIIGTGGNYRFPS